MRYWNNIKWFLKTSIWDREAWKEGILKNTLRIPQDALLWPIEKFSNRIMQIVEPLVPWESFKKTLNIWDTIVDKKFQTLKLLPKVATTALSVVWKATIAKPLQFAWDIYKSWENVVQDFTDIIGKIPTPWKTPYVWNTIKTLVSAFWWVSTVKIFAKLGDFTDWLLDKANNSEFVTIK